MFRMDRLQLISLLVISLAFVGFSAGSLQAEEEVADAQQGALAQGQSLLQAGDFEGAMKAFMTAARENPGNQNYVNQVRVLRRVMALRRFIAEGEVSTQWRKIALSLHSYYLGNKIYGEALALDRGVHAKVNDAKSASMLAETLLETGRNQEAVKVIRELGREKLSLQNRIQLGIALGRLGKAEEAGKIAAMCALPAEASVGLMLDFARMKVLVGDTAGGAEKLVLCLQKTPPSQHALLMGYLKGCADLVALHETPAWAEVLSTKSKIAESGCSGGSSCGSCPNSGGCDKEAESGGCDKQDGEECDKKEDSSCGGDGSCGG